MNQHVELVILVGLQAAGKTSFYREQYAATHVHISKDLLKNNRRPEQRQQELIRAALSAGRCVVVDNTNATRQARALLIGIAREFGAAVVGYYFAAELRECLVRNKQRATGRVPDVALFTTNQRMQTPMPAEGFDRLYVVRMIGGGFVVQDMLNGE